MTDLSVLLQLPFVQSAAIAIIVLAVASAIVGTALALRGLEFLSDGLVHSVFPGVVIGFIAAGTDGVYVGAGIAALLATVALTIATSKGIGSDATIAVVLAGAFSLGIVIVSRSVDYASGLEHLLFGQLLTVSSGDIVAICVLGGAAIVLVLATWKEQLLVSFDRKQAQASGLRVLAYELALNVAIALVVVAAARAVGNLLVLALLIVPVAVARLVVRRVWAIVAVSLLVSVGCGLVGLWAGLWLSLDAGIQASPSAVLVLVLVALYLVVVAVTRLAALGSSDRGRRRAAATRAGTPRAAEPTRAEAVS
ncbi:MULTISPECIES: metal ABC transporter permease [unclassified Pseudoclavibacter]|uniref:metal ABC transporter permease n=1 Tax=unclassified Pseudoclavibacter TaxID=2615177 RepID=UPI001BA65EA3|nr:metal ABC transporter permease [Pseudoclavibacter sp. Marseille-Q4354]MBS3179200.1 metal ABC transporter permease [Pseudoclavibacter sp. Marseille-Q4354]